jgi:hypothetical protein
VTGLGRYLGFRKRKRARRRRLRNPDPVKRPELALKVETDVDSSTLLLAFGGMNQRIGMPPFEFFRLVGDTPVKRVFARDLRQAWYHRGLPGEGDTLLSVRDHLGELIAGAGVERLVVAGGSAGGYAALTYGTLLQADTVLAFSPQTILDLDELAAMNDHRWDDHLEPLVERGELDPSWIDLRTALPRARAGDTLCRVFFDETLATDRLHAERLAGLEGVRLYRFARGSHELVRELRDSGALERVLHRALWPDAGEQGA